ncbi:hypothetical protein EYF80_020337 [Liparis tanakae]|uniref:Uncharacterized protein n=1 Tax=Liparis tanakae TaxID=230148 RepID=A0A4Z2HWY1_9TELE|nr:hypothetical protein EYF80_020337 [Liparis tanakae]
MLCESDACLPNFALLSLKEKPPSPAPSLAPLAPSDTEPSTAKQPASLFLALTTSRSATLNIDGEGEGIADTNR